jgi:hypothetical protein
MSILTLPLLPLRQNYEKKISAYLDIDIKEEVNECDLEREIRPQLYRTAGVHILRAINHNLKRRKKK